MCVGIYICVCVLVNASNVSADGLASIKYKKKQTVFFSVLFVSLKIKRKGQFNAVDSKKTMSLNPVFMSNRRKNCLT
jgi:hypothetical protein